MKSFWLKSYVTNRNAAGKNFFAAFFICIHLSPLLLKSQQEVSLSGIVSSTPVFPFQALHVHGSSIAELPNGDLLSCWFEGSGERQANDVRIMGARWSKGAKTWSKPFEMADTPELPDCNPVLFVNKDGRLFLFWIAVLANRWEHAVIRFKTALHFNEDGFPEWNWQDNIFIQPGNEFAERIKEGLKKIKEPSRGWSEYAPSYDQQTIQAAADARKSSIGWMTRIKPLQTKNGSIILPLYSDGFNLSIMAISNDQGKTWTTSSPIVSRGGIQPALIERTNGEILALMRDNGDEPGNIKMSISGNGGTDWTAAKKISIPNPGSSVEILKLKDGRLILVCNDLEEGRYKLSLYLSTDDGNTWQYSGWIDYDPKKRNGFSYPAVIQDSKGLIHITYSKHDAENGKTIQHVSINPGQISTGR